MIHDIYLSPHLDDACFSLAGTILARGGGELVNVFPRCLHAEQHSPAAETLVERVQRVTALRTAEDTAFAALCKLRRVDLPFATPPVRGEHAFDLRSLPGSVARVRTTLLHAVSGLARRHAPAPPDLFCPLGIGGHADHLATLIVVAEALPALEPVCRVHFYEDLHYAGSADLRERGLARASIVLRGRPPLQRHVHRLSDAAMARKMDLIALYSSQHRGAPVPADFSPADPGAGGPHEAVWSLPGRGPGAPFEPQAGTVLPKPARC